ncbi:hypothetical protein EBR21_12450, partial [bacterium]|nr:hypothetical protein [bacterium]
MSTAVYREDQDAVTETGMWILQVAAIYLCIPVLLFLTSWLNAGAAALSVLLILYGLFTQRLPSGHLSRNWRIPLTLFQKNSVAFV